MSDALENSSYFQVQFDTERAFPVALERASAVLGMLKVPEQ
jgi:hypothetical protein